MSLMDMVKTAAGQILGSKGFDTTNTLGAISKLIEQSGGMNQLVQKFDSAGLGDVVKSWVGTGQNMPVSAEQIANVFGSQNLNQLAQGMNLSSGDLSSTLAKLLPQVVDKLTPNGQISSDNVSLTQLMEIGKSFLAKN